jgi:hypothetical protein
MPKQFSQPRLTGEQPAVGFQLASNQSEISDRARPVELLLPRGIEPPSREWFSHTEISSRSSDPADSTKEAGGFATSDNMVNLISRIGLLLIGSRPLSAAYTRARDVQEPCGISAEGALDCEDALDHLVGLGRVHIAMDVDCEVLAAQPRRTGKAARDARPGAADSEQRSADPSLIARSGGSDRPSGRAPAGSHPISPTAVKPRPARFPGRGSASAGRRSPAPRKSRPE